MSSCFPRFQQVCYNNILHSLNREMYLRFVKKSTLNNFDDIICYESDTKSKPWG